VEEEDEDQLVEQEERQERPGEEGDEEEERRRQRVKLGKPRTPERTSLGMTHEDDEEPRRWSSPWPYSVIDQVFERLMKLSSQLESAVELSSTLQAQHAAVQSTIYALESKATALEELVHAQSQASCPVEPQPEPAQLPNNPTQSRKSSTNGRSPFKANAL
jgi:hypothetical protein